MYGLLHAIYLRRGEQFVVDLVASVFGGSR
jgi:hypothetical protein